MNSKGFNDIQKRKNNSVELIESLVKFFLKLKLEQHTKKHLIFISLTQSFDQGKLF